MRSTEAISKIKLISSMLVFGTIGIFRSYIPYSSGLIAFVRGVMGMLFLLLVIVIGRKKIDLLAIRKNLPLLCLSGAFIGFNWILLFEAYRYTTVATATLCYYMAPVIVIIFSPLILKERLTLKKGLCAISAILGMTVISGIFGDASSDIRGILFGLAAAALYASVIFLNKFIKDIGDYEKTLIQLGTAAIAILPYILLTENISEISFDTRSTLLLVIVGILHTGIAYTLYFGSISRLGAQTAAIFSYIDPVVAVILSAIILKSFGITDLVGSILIIGAAVFSEISFKNFKKTLDKQR